MSTGARPIRQIAKQLVGLRGTKELRVVSGPARGLMFEFDMRDHVGMWLGLYEIELNRHLRRLFQPGSVTLDVGGQFGYDALMASKATGAITYTFECERELCDTIEANARRNPTVGELVRVVHGFVGNGTGASLKLDDFVERENLQVGAVKIDIEGGELEALNGAARLLEQQSPPLIVEVHTHELADECQELLVAAGYAVQTVRARRWLPDYRPDPCFAGWLVGRRP